MVSWCLVVKKIGSSGVLLRAQSSRMRRMSFCCWSTVRRESSISFWGETGRDALSQSQHSVLSATLCYAYTSSYILLHSASARSQKGRKFDEPTSKHFFVQVWMWLVCWSTLLRGKVAVCHFFPQHFAFSSFFFSFFFFFPLLSCSLLACQKIASSKNGCKFVFLRVSSLSSGASWCGVWSISMSIKSCTATWSQRTVEAMPWVLHIGLA